MNLEEMAKIHDQKKAYKSLHKRLIIDLLFNARKELDELKKERDKTKPNCKCNHNCGRTKIESEAWKCNDCDTIFINTKYTK